MREDIEDINDGPTSEDATNPKWTRGASEQSAFRHGLGRCLREPGLILGITSLGFGALAQDTGLSFWNTLAMMALFFALPAQVVWVDHISRGSSFIAGCIAVTLTGVRLLPMTVALMPYLKERRSRFFRMLLAAHFIAVTAWLDGMRWVPVLPKHLRMPYFLGVGIGLVMATLVGTALGHLVAGVLPMEIARVLPFLSPIYFLISMLEGVSTLRGLTPILAGVIIGPLVYLVTPELDLVLAGLVGGTFAHFAAKRWGDG